MAGRPAAWDVDRRPRWGRRGAGWGERHGPILGDIGEFVTAGVAEPGWASELAEPERRAVSTALAGLYKMAGVELVREPIEAALGPGPHSYEFREAGLVVWPDPSSAGEVFYLLRPVESRTPLVPVTPSGEPEAVVPPPIDVRHLLFSAVAVAWKRWVEAWEREQAGVAHTARFLEGFTILPRTGSQPRGHPSSAQKHS